MISILPITGFQHNYLVQGHLETSFTVSETGELEAVTKTLTDFYGKGFTGSVAIALLDENAQQLWVSKERQYTVQGRCMGKWSRRDGWSDQVPQDILSQVRGYMIIHQQVPENRPVPVLLSEI
ncbi:MAG TPA: hypothetical protein V6C91_12240 [Coleofasciculaceae cyanobacterium]